MGARGPRPDPAQAAKGHPGRRKGKAEKAALEHARLAALLAPLPAGSVDLPPMLQEPRYQAAAQVWRKLAPQLKRTQRLPVESEFHFVQLCVYAQEWVEATEDLHTKGFRQTVGTVAGGKMERRRPAVFDRQQAFQNLMELSARFGLTPHDMYALFKGQAQVAVQNPGLFGDSRPPAAAPAPAAEPAAEETSEPSRIGGLGRHRSIPPGTLPN